jgi:hypothetical protein
MHTIFANKAFKTEREGRKENRNEIAQAALLEDVARNGRAADGHKENLWA